MHQFESASIKRRLDGLPSWGRLSFGALLLERAVPNFLQFESETGAQGGAMLRGAQAKLWGLLEGNNAAAPFLRVSEKTCEAFAPDTEQYDSLYTSSALDAVTIACNVLDYVDSHQIDLLAEAASMRVDSVDMFLQLAHGMSPSDPDSEKQLLAHPLMQAELGCQDDDLTFLEKLRSKGADAWTMVLGRSLNLGYSNLRMIPPRG